MPTGPPSVRARGHPVAPARLVLLRLVLLRRRLLEQREPPEREDEWLPEPERPALRSRPERPGPCGRGPVGPGWPGWLALTAPT